MTIFTSGNECNSSGVVHVGYCTAGATDRSCMSAGGQITHGIVFNPAQIHMEKQ